MASLTHVCMWSDNGWKRITAEQAAKLHPGGTVSAHSGLCVNYVGSMSPLLMVRFKHATLDTVPMKKAKIALNVYLEPAIQSLMVRMNTNYQSVLLVCPHLRSNSKLV